MLQKVDFLIELGDFKDQDKPASAKTTLGYLMGKLLRRHPFSMVPE